MRGRNRHVVRLLAIVLLALLLAPLAVAQLPATEDKLRDTTLSQGESRTASGEVIADIWVKMVWVSAAIFLLVTVVLLYSLIRWRKRPGVKREVPQIHGNSKLEIAWTIGPALIMIWLLVISYNGLMAIDLPDVEPEVYVDVVGHRFFWQFNYADGTESVGRNAVLRVEENRWVQLNVTSGDVIHAFAVPGLDVMIDANPGRQNEILFYSGNEPGVYLAQCRQFCGAAHGAMLAALEVFPAGTQDLPYGSPPRERPAAPVPPDNNETADPDNATADVRTIEVVLFDMFIDPAPLEVEPGETIEIVAMNDGPSPHNLYIGTYDLGMGQGEAYCPDPEDDESCWRTGPSIVAGASDRFVFTAPDESIGFDLWCDVEGHVQEGMITFLSVGGGLPAAQEPHEPRLPGPGTALIVAILGAVVLLLRRRA